MDKTTNHTDCLYKKRYGWHSFSIEDYATYQGQILGKPTRVWHIFIENDSQRVLFLERVNIILALGNNNKKLLNVNSCDITIENRLQTWRLGVQIYSPKFF